MTIGQIAACDIASHVALCRTARPDGIHRIGGLHTAEYPGAFTVKFDTRFALRPLALLIASLPLAAAAEDARLGTVVVTAAKDDGQAATVTNAELARLRPATSDAASLLRDIPGVTLSAGGGVSSLPAIHGLADDRLRIKVDGMDLVSACANHMNPALSYIDPSEVAAVKVFAGIAPVSMGGDSIGGTIAVASKPPRFAAAGAGLLKEGEAGAFYRSNGNGSGANLGATLASEALSLGFAASTAQAGNYRAARDFKAATTPTNTNAGPHAIGGDEVASSRYKADNQAVTLALRGQSDLVTLRFGHQYIPYQGFPSQHMDMVGNNSHHADLGYEGKFGWGRLDARLYHEKTRHKMNFGNDRNYYTLGMPMDTEGDNTGASATATLPLSARDTLKLGGDYQRYRLNDWWDPVGTGGMSPDQFQNIHDGKRDRFELFAEWDAQWTAQWLTQLGIRAGNVKMDSGTVRGYKNSPTAGSATYDGDRNAFNAANRARSDNVLDLSALASYVADANASYEGGYARKTRSPNLYERYTWSTGGMAMAMNNLVNDGNGYVGNRDLKPEVAHTLSFTADWHDAAKDGWGLKVTPWLTYVDNYIDARRCPAAASPSGNATCTAATMQTKTDTFVDLQFINQAARLYGVDVSGRLPLGNAGSYGSFALNGQFAYARGSNRDTGDNLYNIMPANLKLAVAHRLGGWSGTLEVQAVSRKKNVSWVRDEMQTAGYGLVNLRGSYEWKQVRLDVGIDNLTNRFYTLPLGGAYIGQGSTMSLNGAGAPWGIPLPGPGRSLYAGVNLKF